MLADESRWAEHEEVVLSDQRAGVNPVLLVLSSLPLEELKGMQIWSVRTTCEYLPGGPWSGPLSEPESKIFQKLVEHDAYPGGLGAYFPLPDEVSVLKGFFENGIAASLQDGSWVISESAWEGVSSLLVVHSPRPVVSDRVGILPYRMTMLELLRHLQVLGWTAVRWSSNEDRPAPHAPGGPRELFLFGALSRWYLAALASSDQLFSQGVQSIVHGEKVSYYKAFFVGGRASKTQGSDCVDFPLFQDGGALEAPVEAPLADLEDGPGELGAVTDTIDVPDAACPEAGDANTAAPDAAGQQDDSTLVPGLAEPPLEPSRPRPEFSGHVIDWEAPGGVWFRFKEKPPVVSSRNARFGSWICSCFFHEPTQNETGSFTRCTRTMAMSASRDEASVIEELKAWAARYHEFADRHAHRDATKRAKVEKKQATSATATGSSSRTARSAKTQAAAQAASSSAGPVEPAGSSSTSSSSASCRSSSSSSASSSSTSGEESGTEATARQPAPAPLLAEVADDEMLSHLLDCTG